MNLILKSLRNDIKAISKNYELNDFSKNHLKNILKKYNFKVTAIQEQHLLTQKYDDFSLNVLFNKNDDFIKLYL